MKLFLDFRSNLWKIILCLFFSFCTLQMQADDSMDNEVSSMANDINAMAKGNLSYKKYAKYIEVEAYYVTKEQVVQVFSADNFKVSQKKNKELFGKELFLLIRCKNIGDYRAFGVLNCKTSNSQDPIPIHITLMPGYMKSFHDSVLYIGSGTVSNDSAIPVFNCDWKSLNIL